MFVFRNRFLSPNPPNWKETLFTTACSPAVGILHASLILHEPKDARVAKQRPHGRHSKFFPAWVETGADRPYLSHHQGFFPQLSLSLHGAPFVSFILPTFTMRYPLTLQVPIPALPSRQRRSAVLEAKANCETFDQCRHPLTSRRKPIESSRSPRWEGAAAPGTNVVVRLEVANIFADTSRAAAAAALSVRTGLMRPASDRLAAAKRQEGGGTRPTTCSRSNNTLLYKMLEAINLNTDPVPSSRLSVGATCASRRANTHPTPTHWPVPTVPDPSPRPPAQHQRKSPGSTSPTIPDPNQAPGRSALLRAPSIHCRDAMPDLDIKSCFPIWTCPLLQTPSHTHPTTHTPYHHARFLRYPHLADLRF